MNRIVQRNGAAPPWVELQTGMYLVSFDFPRGSKDRRFEELDSSLQSFRASLQASWTRRAIRMLSLSLPPTALATLAPSDISSLRDSEWEARECAYHDAAIEEVNSLVRRYNGVAPYPVRRPYHDRKGELDRVYKESVDGILKGLEERARDIASGKIMMGGGYGEEDGGRSAAKGIAWQVTSSAGSQSRWGVWKMVRGWFASPEPDRRS